MTPGAWLAPLTLLVLAVAAATVTRRVAERRPAGRRFFRHPPAEACIGILVFFVALAVAAPLVAPYHPDRQPDIVGLQHVAPSWDHPMGTDLYSRDVWSRLAFGTRISLAVGALATLVAVTLGTLVGAAAGYVRRLDPVLMRLVDMGLAMPRLFILLVLVALWDQLPLPVLILAIGGTTWFATSRVVRADVLRLRELPFVEAARAAGARPARVVLRHVLPNAAAPVIVSAAIGLGNVLLLESGLSFLGIGVRPPTPSWGNMIAEGAHHVTTAPWATVFPG
ncbi:MAG: ABC transporter permease, partial [Acidimicrobiales bacterium]